MPRRDAYIYFRVARADEAAAVAVLRELQARWAAHVSCELLRRTDDRGDTVTLMEVYRGVTPALQQRIEDENASRLAPWLIGTRHVEIFEECGPPLAALATPQGGAQPPRGRPSAG